ncbi:hypothetical protein C3V36_05080 [Lachnospiraceae bacterium oral taxon 500]|nr:hypothetical protein C3V36_05080 [Lachnospiraceae bacterium oral taxon 500]
MSGERIKRKSMLAKLMVLIMTVNLLQGMVTLPITAEAGETDHVKNLGAVNGAGNNEGITIEEYVTDYNNGQFKVNLKVNGAESTTQQIGKLDVFLLIDRSGSMNDHNRMKNAKKAAKSFVDKLLITGKDNVRVGVVSFASDHGAAAVSVDHGLSTNKPALKTAIDGIIAVGGTYVDKGLEAVKEQFRLYGHSDARKIVILIADGQPTFAYEREEKKVNSNLPAAGYEIWHHEGSLTNQSLWNKDYGNNTNSYKVKLVHGTEHIGNGNNTGDIGRVARNTIMTADDLKAANIEIIPVGIDMTTGTERHFMTLVSSTGQYYNANTTASNLDKILNDLHQTITTAKVRDGVMTVPVSDKINFSGELDKIKISVINTNTNQPIANNISKKWDSTKRIITLDKITLKKNEQLLVTYPASLKEEWMDHAWHEVTVDRKTVLKPMLSSPETDVMAFKVPEVKDFKSVDIVVNKTWTVNPPATVEEVPVSIEKTVDGTTTTLPEKLIVKKQGNTWTGSKAGLPMYQGGQKIKYDIKEDSITNYQPEYTRPNEMVNGKLTFGIKNINTEMLQVKVVKKWLGTMPSVLKIDLYQEGSQQFIDSITLKKPENNASTWEGTFTKSVRKYDDDGKLLRYKLVEHIDETKYQADETEIILTPSEDKVLMGTFTNRDKRTQDLKVEKKWVNTPVEFQKEVVVQLYRKTDENAAPQKVEGKRVKLNKDGSFKGEFENLPVYDSMGNGATGKKFIYSVQEEDVPVGYDVKYSGDGSADNPFVVTNTNIETTTIQVTKIWKGEPLSEGATIELYKGAAKINEAKVKENHTFTTDSAGKELPKYENGKLVSYTVKEKSMPNYNNGKPATATGNQEKGFQFTNLNTVKDVSVTVTKKWVGKVGDKITLTLSSDQLVDGQKVEITEEVTGTGKEWKHTFTGLRKYDDEGNKMVYTVKEAKLENYETSIDETGLVFTNTYSNKTTTAVTVSKIWKGNVGSKAKIQLLANGKEEIELVINGQFQTLQTQIVELKDGNWQHTFQNLRKEDQNGKDIKYTVKELEVDANYTMADPEEIAANNFTITNTNHEKVKVVVKKTWRGEKQDTVFELLKNGSPTGKEMPLTKGQSQVEFTDLDKYEDKEVTAAAKPIVYTVQEKGQTGQTVTLGGIEYKVEISDAVVDNDGNTTINVINISQEKVVIQVRKEWVRRVGQSVEIVLLEKDTDNPIPGVDPITLTKEDKEWDNLPFSKSISVLKYDQTDGREYKFWIKETKINGTAITGNDYDSKVEPVGQLGYCFKAINTNKEATDVTVSKAWVNGETKRPQSVVVTLKATVGTDDADVIDAVLAGWANAPAKEQTLKEPNWNYVYTNLPKYYNNQAVKYSVTEKTVPLFTASVTETANGILVTNTFKEEKADVQAMKIWVGGTEAEHVEVELTLQYRVKGSANEADWKNWTGSAAAVKENANTWTYTWKEVPQTDSQGRAYEFRAIETKTPDNYQVEHKGLTVTNTSFEKTSRKVIKTWLGDAKEVNVTLTGTVDDTEVYKSSRTISATPDNNGVYQVEFKDLLRYDVQRTDGSTPTGKEIEYKLVEETGTGFTLVSGPTWNQIANAFMITNRNTESKEITIVKEWENTPKALIDAARVVVKLYRQSENAAAQVFGAPITLNEADYDTAGEKFVKTLSVPKFDEQGNAYIYTVKEVSINGKKPAEAGYNHTENGLIIVNTNDEKVTVEVQKSWQGPKKDVTFTLYKGNPDAATAQKVGEEILTAGTEKLSFAPVAKYENGELIEYYVKEEKLDGYEETAAQKVDSIKPQVSFVNKNVETVSISVNKVWDNAPKEHQKEVEVTLYVQNLNGNQEIVEAVPEQKATLKQNALTHIFTAPKYDESGNQLAYYVFETKVGTTGLNASDQFDNEDSYQLSGEKYQLEIKRDPANSGDVTVILTNTNVQTTEVKVEKQWVGPTATAQITLWNGQEQIAKTEIKGNTSFTFTKDAGEKPLPKRKEGEIITYTVTEEAIVNYNNDSAADAQKQDDGSYLFVNQYTKTRDITVQKVWKPAKTELTEVEIALVGKVGDTVVVPEQKVALKASEGWKYSFTGLAEYHGADKIIYTVTEEALANYPNPRIVDDSNNQSENDKNVFTITNTYKNDDTVEVSVSKVWKGYKTDSVTVALLRDGVATGDPLVLNGQNKWTGKFTGLKKMNDATAEAYAYDVKELSITGFTSVKTGSTENGFTFTNTVKPDIPDHKITLEVEKFFIGQEQDSVDVQIFANGIALPGTLTLTKDAAGKWIGSRELPKYDANVVVTNADIAQIQPIVYTVKELDDAGVAFGDGQLITLNNHEYKIKINNAGQNKWEITNISQAKMTINITKKWVRKVGDKVSFKLLLTDGSQYGDPLVLEGQNGNSWTGNFNVPIYDDEGRPIAYADVTEEISAEYEQTSKTGSIEDGYTFTNTNKETTNGEKGVTIKKVWIGGENKKQEVTVNLIATDGENALTLADVLADFYTGPTSFELNVDNEWTVTVKGLPKYFNNKEVVYSVEEVEVPCFTTKITPMNSNSVDYVITVINTFKSPQKEVKVKKLWVNTPDSITESLNSSVTVQLYRRIADEPVATAVIPEETRLLNLNTGWTNSFLNVDELDPKGNPYIYSVKETLINGQPIDNSQYLVDDSGEGYDLTVTNTNIETMTIKVVKKWLGEDAADDGASFNLWADGVLTENTLHLDKNTNEGSFTGVFPKYINRRLVVYKISEDEIPGYKQYGEIDSATQGNTITFTVTNSKVKDITVQKTWIGAAAEEVSFGLYQGEVLLKKLTLKEANLNSGVWTDTFKDVFVYDENGNIIDYSVRELNQDGTPVLPLPGGITKAIIGGTTYQVTVEVTGDVHKFTNTALSEIEVEKVWKGQVATGASVTLALYDVESPDANTNPVQTMELPINDGWTGKFENLPTHTPAGEKIRYSVKETKKNADDTYQIIQPDRIFELGGIKYKLQESTDNGKLIFTNIEYLDIAMTKVWDDKFSMVLRESVMLTLYSFEDGTADFMKLEDFILNEANDWTQVKTDLPRWANGKYISYRVVEKNINDEATLMPWDYQNPFLYKVFAVSIEPKDITATAKVTVTNGVIEVEQPEDPNYRNLRVAKFWGATAEEHQKLVRVELFVKNEEGHLEPTGQTLVLNQANNWVGMFENLPKFRVRKVSADKLSTETELKDEELPAGAPNAEEAQKPADGDNQPTTQTGNNSEPISEEKTEPAEDSSTTTEEPAAPEESTENSDANATEESSAAEQAAETEIQSGGSAHLKPAEEAEETPAAEEGQSEEAPQTEQGQGEEVPRAKDGQELTIEEETLPLGEPLALKEIEYFVFETEIDGQRILFTPEEGLTDYHFGDYQIKIVAQEDTVYIKNLHASAIPDDEKININVAKDWTGVAQIRIKDVEVALYVQVGDTLKQVVKEPLVLGEANNFKGVFANLRKKNDDGEELRYYVFETKIGEEVLSFEPAVDLTQYYHGAYRITIIDNGSVNVTLKNYYQEEPLDPWKPDDDDDDEQPKPQDPQDPTPDQPKPPVGEEETIPESKVPEGNPTETLTETPATEETVIDEEIPQGKTELPKTDGVARSLFYLLGSGLAALGLGLKRKKK